MKRVGKVFVPALVLVGLGWTSPAHAEEGCDGAPATVGPYEDGAQVCIDDERFDGTVSATPTYVAADGAHDNPYEPTDGYAAVDGNGVAACSSGDYTPGGENAYLGSHDTSCDPQTPSP